jgi:hypothetical protein
LGWPGCVARLPGKILEMETRDRIAGQLWAILSIFLAVGGSLSSQLPSEQLVELGRLSAVWCSD